MIKLIKLDKTYIDLSSIEFDVFMVTYSDIELLEYGDFILDDKNLNTSIEMIENYLNDPNINRSKVLRFTYKINDIRNKKFEYKFIEHTHLFLLSIFREYQFDNIFKTV